MLVDILLLGLLVAAALWAVLTPTLLRSAIALAAASAVLTLLMFQMHSPLAAVFELSVCAGLITVVFVATISLTRNQAPGAAHDRRVARVRRFLPLVAVLAAVGGALWFYGYHLDVAPSRPAPITDLRQVLWTLRRFDLIGQLLVIFAGVFGVVVLFKEGSNIDKETGK